MALFIEDKRQRNCQIAFLLWHLSVMCHWFEYYEAEWIPNFKSEKKTWWGLYCWPLDQLRYEALSLQDVNTSQCLCRLRNLIVCQLYKHHNCFSLDPPHNCYIFRCRVLPISKPSHSALSTDPPSFLSPSGDLGIGLVWDNHPHHPQLFGPTVEILFKLN